jgi:hypothetical protein
MTQMLVNGPTVTVATALTERCDRCGAAAKVRIVVAAGELAFCGHHANRYSENVNAVAEQVVVESGFAWQGAPTA